MSRIRIENLPSDLAIGPEEMRRIHGGVCNIPPTVVSLTGGPISIPFPNIGDSGDSGESTVHYSSSPPDGSSSSGSSQGDEAGSSGAGGGIVSGGAKFP